MPFDGPRDPDVVLRGAPFRPTLALARGHADIQRRIAVPVQ
jgi:hypothetical protein